MPRCRRLSHYLATLALICLPLLVSRVEACMVCIPYPEETGTDRLLHADAVVFARENPEQPFSYSAVEVLKDDVEAPPIDLFLPSTTRKRLALRPEDSVALAFDAANNEWRSAGYATPAYQELVRKIVMRAPAWNRSARAESRARFFVPYLASEDESVHKLAYLEVGQSSYDTIREADSVVPAAQVHRFLNDLKYIEWHALYILLLGVDAQPEEERIIRQAMESRARLGLKLNLSAWATALIEIDGAEAVEWLERHYLGVADRESDAVVEVVKALSVQGARNRSSLRQRIADSYALLIQTHPSLAGWAARDLASWNDWRFADALAEVRDGEQDLDGAAAFSINYYIRRAQSRASN
ncbi:hypothetical protein LPB19_16170 [Marinobacter salinisoli]|uniref:Uncharacterized protein n=1 Tax=Marinobacter salinisoli TaxID=2769486 RepID=A0ABX7MTA7_9GAMM|nr:hypothetical protein [Marinobacter salinisoli]QSP94685.1 hypothetical protein LPB19_16170 [Marinobacter salinisoli]